MGSFLTVIVGATVTMVGLPPDSSQSATARSDWYLVEEVIEDRLPDYRSDIYFADKASIVKSDKQSSIAISHLVLTQVSDESDSPGTRIRDTRSRLAINCDERTYSTLESAEFDQDNNQLSQQKTESKLAEWVLPIDGSGFASIVEFACAPERNLGEQKFKGDILPLIGLMAWLNADWRN